MRIAKEILKAVEFAAEKHRNQRRKGVEASPYINHPIQVAELIARVGEVDDVEVLIAAVLHDTVEDTETTFEELEQKFGSIVRDLVAEVSDDKTLPKAERKRLQVEHAQHMSVRAKLIKIADKACNVRDVALSPPEEWDMARRNAYLGWAHQVVDGCRGTNSHLEQYFDETLDRCSEVLGIASKNRA